MPGWEEALAQRLEFFLRPDDAELVAALALLERAPDNLLRRFLDACLAVFAEQVARRPELAAVRAELDELCDLARAALDSDCDDRPLLPKEDALMERPNSAGSCVRVPGRVVWLAAMVAQVPSEQGPAVVMLANDLATLGLRMPLRALQVALRY